MNGEDVDYTDFAREWAWTRPRHGGDVEAAAMVFGIPVSTLLGRLVKARKHGVAITWTQYTTGERAS